MVPSEEVQIIYGLRAPNVRTLNLIFSGCAPELKSIYTPRLSEAIIHQVRDPEGQHSFDTESWKFLLELRVLRLCWYLEPLYHFQFNSLKVLYLLISENAMPVPTDLPELAELIVRVYSAADRVPEIIAEKLEFLAIICEGGSEFDTTSLIPTFARYPRLKDFEFKQRAQRVLNITDAILTWCNKWGYLCLVDVDTSFLFTNKFPRLHMPLLHALTVGKNRLLEPYNLTIIAPKLLAQSFRVSG
jgi:hypothetical protein